MTQLEATLDVIKDRSGDAMDAVQHGVNVVSHGVSHGVEVLGTKLGVIEPPPARRVWPWMVVVGVVAVIVGLLVWRFRRRAAAEAEAEPEERVAAPRPLRQSA